MVEFLPYLLILVGWQTADPQGTMDIQQSFVASEDICEAKGKAFMDRQSEEASHKYRLDAYRYFCVQAPRAEEYQELFEQLK